MSAAALAALPEAWSRRISTARDLVRTQRAAPRREHLATASPELDTLLAGGLERGALTELCGWRSSGRFGLVLAALAEATRAGEAVALIDLGDGFDPHAGEAAGIELERLLWARPQTMREALRAAEAILACGLALVVIDLGTPPITGGRGAEAAWRRLAAEAGKQRVALLVSSPYRVTSTAARAVIEARGGRAAWQGGNGYGGNGYGRNGYGSNGYGSNGYGSNGYGSNGHPKLLCGIDTRLELLKHRDLHDTKGVALGLRLEEDLGGVAPGGASAQWDEQATNILSFPAPNLGGA